MERRRSEVDRRLDSLVNQSTRALRQANRTNVLKLLRLFNLCDVSTNTADIDKARKALGSPRKGAQARIVQNAVDQSEVRHLSTCCRTEWPAQKVHQLLAC